MHNEHVYKYWRWRAWVADQSRRLLAATFFYQWAQDERNLQCKFNHQDQLLQR